MLPEDGRFILIIFIFVNKVKVREKNQSEPEGPVGPTVAAPTPLQAENRVVSETPAIKMASIEQRWNSLDILLFDYQKYINMANLYSIRLESNKPTIF